MKSWMKALVCGIGAFAYTAYVYCCGRVDERQNYISPAKDPAMTKDPTPQETFEPEDLIGSDTM